MGDISGHLGVGVPTGEFADHVDEFVGGGLSLTAFFDLPIRLGLRFDASWLSYGTSDFRVPVTPVVDADVTTSNTVTILTLSPLVELTRGRVRPYVQGLVGASRFSTTTTISGGMVATPTDLEDWNVPLGIGAGLRLDLRMDPSFPEFLPVAELGATYIHHASVRYLTEDRVRAAFDAGVPIDPIRSNASLVLIQLRLGFTF